MKSWFVLASLVSVGFLSVGAASILPTSYDMLNGHGQASGGSFNYWDKNYSGVGSTTVDAAPLSGGLGDLTDGVIATENWFAVENSAGTGPYVGWRAIDPIITFHFAGPVSIDSLTLYLDDSGGAGGVSLPSAIDYSIDGGSLSSIAVVDGPGTAPVAFVLPLGATVNSELAVTLRRNNEWVFLSEVTFEGRGPSVPDGLPTLGALALALGAKGFLGAARRR